MTSQLVIFRVFCVFFVPLTLNLNKKSCKSPNKKFWPKQPAYGCNSFAIFHIDSFIASADFDLLLIIFANNSSDLDQTRQMAGSDLDQNCLTF